MRKTGFPKRYELVVCKIIKINPHSAIAELIEYKKTGYIQAPEVARKWVKDIRSFIKVGQYVVCKVMYIEPHSISISIKRVFPEEANRKLVEFKKERKAERQLELIAKDSKKTLDQIYEEAGYDIQEEFGSISKGFEFALKKPELFKQRVPKKWAEKIIEFLKTRVTAKVFDAKAELKLICYKPNGIEVIKSVLSNVNGLEVKYISTPKYLLVGKGKNAKTIFNKVEQKAEEIVKEINKQDGDCSFKMVEK